MTPHLLAGMVPSAPSACPVCAATPAETALTLMTCAAVASVTVVPRESAPVVIGTSAPPIAANGPESAVRSALREMIA